MSQFPARPASEPPAGGSLYIEELEGRFELATVALDSVDDAACCAGSDCITLPGPTNPEPS